MSGLNPGTVGAVVSTIDQSQARRLGINFSTREVKSLVSFVYSQSTRCSQAFGPSIRPGCRWRGSKPRQKGPCRSQGIPASHCVTDGPRSKKKIFVKTSARATFCKLISGF
ncbi:hypothetical protein PoB_002351200 [Plakobranchus ocellatus]|uniref:Uncharacterized protein n=1 Tax=Plakobranchus ocellatus TaxID=259542 RepID=A0AAV3ZP76_9GAST|nr:hypothetical protein PoB_002351200 [Plakobranchus ocellatus]